MARDGFGQDVHFSQFQLTPMLINPASTGVYAGTGRGSVNYRSQWGVTGEAYNTMMAAFDMGILKDMGYAYLGVGGYAYKDVAGTSEYGNTVASLSVSGVLAVSEHGFLSVGLHGAYGQYSADLSKLTWGNQYTGDGFDTNINPDEQTNFKGNAYADVGAGVSFELDNSQSSFVSDKINDLKLGVAVFHLNRPNQGVSFDNSFRLPVKFVAHAMMENSFNQGYTSLVPSVFFAKQGAHSELNAGALLKLHFGTHTKYSGLFKESNLYIGSHYRFNDAIIAEVYYEIMDYMIGFSYDFTTSDFRSTSSGRGFEVSLRYVNRAKAIQAKSFK